MQHPSSHRFGLDMDTNLGFIECSKHLYIFSAGGVHPMIIGDRLRALREEKKLSQGDIEKRTGLLRCYISRVENGHTVPAIETLRRWLGLWKFPCTSFSTTVMS